MKKLANSLFGSLENNSLPIGLITSRAEFEKVVNELAQPADELIELSEDSTIDDIKNFRKKLIDPTLHRKIGVIYRLDKFSDAKQAVLLKIFETALENVVIFFHAAYLPDYTIQTRSKIYYLEQEAVKIEVSTMMDKILNAMKSGDFDINLSRKWKIFIRTQSLLMDEIITENEKNTILKGLAL